MYDGGCIITLFFRNLRNLSCMSLHTSKGGMLEVTLKTYGMTSSLAHPCSCHASSLLLAPFKLASTSSLICSSDAAPNAIFYFPFFVSLLWLQRKIHWISRNSWVWVKKVYKNHKTHMKRFNVPKMPTKIHETFFKVIILLKTKNEKNNYLNLYTWKAFTQSKYKLTVSEVMLS